MRQTILHTILALALPLLFTAPVHSAEFNAMSGSLPPYSINKGLHLKGISVDTLVIIMSLAGSPLEANDIKLMLWKHAFNQTKAGPSSILLNVPKAPTHANMFKWVGPIHTSRYVLIGNKDNPIVISSPKELDSLKTATIRGSAPQKALLKEGVSKNAILPFSSHILPLKQLKNKQVDFFAFGEYNTAYLMKAMGMDTKKYKVFYTIQDVPLYFAFSKDTDDALIKRLNENLKKMKKPGPDGKSRFDKIVAKYLPEGTIK